MCTTKEKGGRVRTKVSEVIYYDKYSEDRTSMLMNQKYK